MDAASRVTQKFQTTIPAKIRKLLGIKAGDVLSFEIRDGEILISKAKPFDLAFTKSLEGSLSEWASKEDEEAYGDL